MSDDEMKREIIQNLACLSLVQLLALSQRVKDLSMIGYGKVELIFWNGHPDVISLTVTDKLTGKHP
jgi:hypothetical protein